MWEDFGATARGASSASNQKQVGNLEWWGVRSLAVANSQPLKALDEFRQAPFFVFLEHDTAGEAMRIFFPLFVLRTAMGLYTRISRKQTHRRGGFVAKWTT
jgi:hypothetical protein